MVCISYIYIYIHTYHSNSEYISTSPEVVYKNQQPTDETPMASFATVGVWSVQPFCFLVPCPSWYFATFMTRESHIVNRIITVNHVKIMSRHVKTSSPKKKTTEWLPFQPHL